MKKLCWIKTGISAACFELLVLFVIILLFVIRLVKNERLEFPCKIKTRFITKLLMCQKRQDKTISQKRI